MPIQTPPQTPATPPERRGLHLPHIGWRSLKTAGTASLLALIYLLFDRNPAFACIGVVFGMGSDLESSRLHGGNRLFGTLIGGLLSIVLFRIYLFFYPQGGHSVMLAILLFFGILALILLCQRFWVGAVQPGGVVLCIVLFSTPVDTYVSYALNRIFDTGVGVAAAILVNILLSREHLDAWDAKAREILQDLHLG